MIVPFQGLALPKANNLPVNFGMVLIFAAALAVPSPAPMPTPTPAATPGDPCGGAHTALLSALNRPTIGFSPCAVKPRETVVEAGYANQSGGQAMTIYPQGFIRLGAAPNLELDIAGPNGKFDSGFGLKYELGHDSQHAYAIDALYTLPTGSAQYTSGAPSEQLNFDYSAPLTPGMGFGATVGVANSAAQALDGHVARTTTLLPSAVVTTLLNDRTQLYLEGYGSTRLRPDGGSLLGLDGGVQYLISPQFEIDAELGRTITDIAVSHYAGIGIGVRF